MAKRAEPTLLNEKIVPIEPTDAMLEAGRIAAEANLQVTLNDRPALYYAYRAMIEAAP